MILDSLFWKAKKKLMDKGKGKGDKGKGGGGLCQQWDFFSFCKYTKVKKIIEYIRYNNKIPWNILYSAVHTAQTVTAPMSCACSI